MVNFDKNFLTNEDFQDFLDQDPFIAGNVPEKPIFPKQPVLADFNDDYIALGSALSEYNKNAKKEYEKQLALHNEALTKEASRKEAYFKNKKEEFEQLIVKQKQEELRKQQEQELEEAAQKRKSALVAEFKNFNKNEHLLALTLELETLDTKVNEFSVQRANIVSKIEQGNNVLKSQSLDEATLAGVQNQVNELLKKESEIAQKVLECTQKIESLSIERDTIDDKYQEMFSVVIDEILNAAGVQRIQYEPGKGLLKPVLPRNFYNLLKAFNLTNEQQFEVVDSYIERSIENECEERLGAVTFVVAAESSMQKAVHYYKAKKLCDERFACIALECARKKYSDSTGPVRPILDSIKDVYERNDDTFNALCTKICNIVFNSHILREALPKPVVFLYEAIHLDLFDNKFGSLKTPEAIEKATLLLDTEYGFLTDNYKGYFLHNSVPAITGKVSHDNAQKRNSVLFKLSDAFKNEVCCFTESELDILLKREYTKGSENGKVSLEARNTIQKGIAEIITTGLTKAAETTLKDFKKTVAHYIKKPFVTIQPLVRKEFTLLKLESDLVELCNNPVITNINEFEKYQAKTHSESYAKRQLLAQLPNIESSSFFALCNDFSYDPSGNGKFINNEIDYKIGSINAMRDMLLRDIEIINNEITNLGERPDGIFAKVNTVKAWDDMYYMLLGEIEYRDNELVAKEHEITALENKKIYYFDNPYATSFYAEIKNLYPSVKKEDEFIVVQGINKKEFFKQLKYKLEEDVKKLTIPQEILEIYDHIKMLKKGL